MLAPDLAGRLADLRPEQSRPLPARRLGRVPLRLHHDRGDLDRELLRAPHRAVGDPVFRDSPEQLLALFRPLLDILGEPPAANLFTGTVHEVVSPHVNRIWIQSTGAVGERKAVKAAMHLGVGGFDAGLVVQ